MGLQTRNDRRLNPRIKTEVRCWLERESITLLGMITNMSFGGFFFRTPVTLPLGHAVTMKLDVESGQVAVEGQVIWSASSEQRLRWPGLGIRIERILEGEKLLKSFIERSPLAWLAGDTDRT